ncbi:rod shape-determining protein RodA [Amphibacillus sp. Q70]|uniref:rod shape-determining protein RodA n=1 Tax=Amphibacillus sp. Q70 TaxID=3453416 RepID=UPI003F82C633
MQSKKLPIDYTIVFLLICFLIISLVAIYSGSGQYASANPMRFVNRQLLFYGVGFIAMMVIAFFDFELIERWTWPIYSFGMVLLLVVEFFGEENKGAQRWINLGFMELQPSEFMKIFLVLHIAALLTKVGKQRLNFKESILITLKIIIYTILPVLLILKQPDLGTALMILFTIFMLILTSSISIKMSALLAASGLSGLGALIYLYFYNFDLFSKFISSHQLPRIYGWLNPSEYSQGFGYQLQQALLGIGSGQLTGSGLKQGYQIQSGRVPEAHTDFIFAVIGEDFGFLGTSILVILFFLLIYRIINIALNANSLFGVYICIGVISLFTFQIFQNIGMTIGLMPITGIALPFISYGGSTLLANMMALGLVTSVHLRTKKYMFGEEESME